MFIFRSGGIFCQTSAPVWSRQDPSPVPQVVGIIAKLPPFAQKLDGKNMSTWTPQKKNQKKKTATFSVPVLKYEEVCRNHTSSVCLPLQLMWDCDCCFPLFNRWIMQLTEPSLAARSTPTEPSRRRWLAWLCCIMSLRSDGVFFFFHLLQPVSRFLFCFHTSLILTKGGLDQTVPVSLCLTSCFTMKHLCATV